MGCGGNCACGQPANAEPMVQEPTAEMEQQTMPEQAEDDCCKINPEKECECQ